MQLDQSALTGESLPVEADADAPVYAGAIVKRGEATGQVTATGVRTYFGRTAELVRTAQTVSPPPLAQSPEAHASDALQHLFRCVAASGTKGACPAAKLRAPGTCDAPYMPKRQRVDATVSDTVAAARRLP